jgi:hypothetical protein
MFVDKKCSRVDKMKGFFIFPSRRISHREIPFRYKNHSCRWCRFGLAKCWCREIEYEKGKKKAA